MISTIHSRGAAGLNASASARDGAPKAQPQPAHEPFSWLNEGLTNDPQAQFVALTMDVCNGMQTCLQLLHSDLLTRNNNQWAAPGDAEAPLLDQAAGERLLLLATAAARMLSERAEERIEALNERGTSTAALAPGQT